MTTRDYGHGTYITRSGPWQINTSGRVLCSDGRVRALARISATADTLFSVSAAVKVKGRTVSGFITVNRASWDDDTPTVLFHAYTYGKNGHLLPDIPYHAYASGGAS